MTTPKKPRLIFSTGSLYPLDTSDCFQLAEDAGFDGIEIMCDPRHSTRDPDYLTALSEKHNLPIMVCHTPFTTNVSGWKVSGELDLVLQTLELAKQLNSESIVVHLPAKVGEFSIRTPLQFHRLPWIINPEAEIKRWIENDLAELQASTPINIALENIPKRKFFGRKWDVFYWNSPAEWSTVHSALTLDTTHWATKDINPTEMYLLAKDNVKNIHLSNYASGVEHRLPQIGDLDLAEFLETIVANNYSGTVSVELHPNALGFPDRKAIAQNLYETVAFCRQYLSI